VHVEGNKFIQGFGSENVGSNVKVKSVVNGF
jgi:hypothetical protein